jgi:hypothetical protein
MPGNGIYFFPQKVNKNSRLRPLLPTEQLRLKQHCRKGQGRIRAYVQVLLKESIIKIKSFIFKPLM